MSASASGIRRLPLAASVLAFGLLASPPDGFADDAVPLAAPARVSSPLLSEDGGDPQAVAIRLPSLAPTSQAGADARTAYAIAVRTELEAGPLAALPYYREVLRKDPSFVDLYLKVSLDYVQQRQTDNAEKILRDGIAANPRAGDLYAGLAYIKQAQNKLPEAFDLAQKAKLFSPCNNLAHRIAFETLRDQGKLDAATDLARAAAKIPAARQDEWASLARLYTELICATGQLTRLQVAGIVLPLYDKAFALGSPGADLLRQRGDFSLFLEKKDEAYEFLKKAAAQSDVVPDAALDLRLANLASDLGRGGEALPYYEQAYALEPDFPQLRDVLALQYVQAGRNDDAAALLEEAVRQNPGRADAYGALADLYSRMGRLDKAEFNYRRVLATAGKQAQAADYLKLVVVLLQEKRLPETEAALREAQERFPDAPRLAFFDGIVQRELKRPQAALDRFAQARLLAKDKEDDLLDADYYYELSLAQEQAGQADACENSLKLGLSLDPHSGDILNALAYFWAEADRNLPQALKYSQQAADAAPDRGEFVDTLGWVYFRLGKYDRAAFLLQHAALLTRDDPVVLGHLADTYLKLGRKDDAGQALHRLVDKDPQNAEARKKLENFLSGQDVASTKSVTKP